MILYPAAFYFKEERVLAAHPSSCHPWRVFGCPENERKWEKVREKGKSGRVESFLPNLLISRKVVSVTVQLELIYCPQPSKITKNQNQKLL